MFLVSHGYDLDTRFRCQFVEYAIVADSQLPGRDRMSGQSFPAFCLDVRIKRQVNLFRARSLRPSWLTFRLMERRSLSVTMTPAPLRFFVAYSI